MKQNKKKNFFHIPGASFFLGVGAVAPNALSQLRH